MEVEFERIKRLVNAINDVYDNLWVGDESAAIKKIASISQEYDLERASQVSGIVGRNIESLKAKVKNLPFGQLAQEAGFKVPKEDKNARNDLERRWIMSNAWTSIEQEGVKRLEIMASSLRLRLERIKKGLEPLERQDTLEGKTFRTKRTDHGRYILLPISPSRFMVRMLFDKLRGPEGAKSAISHLRNTYGLKTARTAETKSGPTIRMYSTELFLEASFYDQAAEISIDMREPSEDLARTVAEHVMKVVCANE